MVLRPSTRSVIPYAVLSAAVGLALGHPAEAATPTIHPDVRAAIERGDEVDVIVNLRVSEPRSIFHNLPSHRKAIAEIRDMVLASIPNGFALRRQFDHIPAVAGRMSAAAVEALAADPNVLSIQVDSRGGGALTVSVPAIRGDIAKADYQVTGKGVRVAVLDTGVNSMHSDLKSSILSTQRCFTHNACPPNNASTGTSAEDDHGHGSHVTGIITSDGLVAGVGFAPDAEIVAVKVDDRNDSGYESDWAAGLDWVFSNLSTLNVKIVNMSICTNNMYATASECDAAEPALARAIKNLVDAGVTVFAASGNRGDRGKLSAPACNTGVIAVGATYKSDQGRQPANGSYSQEWGDSFANCADSTTAFDKVACFTNSGPRLDLVAPGAVIVSDDLGTQTKQYRGTSQASPTAAGVAALMLECNPRLTPASIKDILIRTGASVTDPKNGLSFPSIRADQAVKEACASGGQDGGTPTQDSGIRDDGPVGKDGAAGSGGSGGSMNGFGGIGGFGGWTGIPSIGGWTGIPSVGGWTGIPSVGGWTGIPSVGGWTGIPGLGGTAAGGSGVIAGRTGAGGTTATSSGGTRSDSGGKLNTGGSSGQAGAAAAGSSGHGGASASSSSKQGGMSGGSSGRGGSGSYGGSSKRGSSSKGDQLNEDTWGCSGCQLGGPSRGSPIVLISSAWLLSLVLRSFRRRRDR